MKDGCNIAIAGATGAVGVEMIKTLEKRNFPVKSIKLLASSRSVGKEMMFKGEVVKVEELKHDSFEGIDIALFSAGADRSKEFASSAVKAGAVVVDNSSAFRMDADVPLVVPEVNPEAVLQHKGIIANPNCSTIIMVVAVNPLHKVKKLRRLIASTYQAASGAGAAGMQELEDNTRAMLNGEDPAGVKFTHNLAFNLLPHIDVFQENGYTKEEMKMTFETRKIMSLPELQVSCTCVRVPVPRAHSEALNMEFEDEVTVEEVKTILATAPGVILKEDIANNVYPMPVDASGIDEILVGRIRQDSSRNDNRGIDMFISGDQILKGAALNAVQIAECIVKNG